LQAAKEASLIPAGMRLLSDEERIETLEILESNRQEVEHSLQRMPVVVETLSQVKHKTQLERKLNEIEEAKRIFSRPKVLVKNDA
jgi:Calmodulin-binding